LPAGSCTAGRGFIRAVALDVIVVAMWMTLTVVEEAA
jgi:hypothetical protein